MPIALTETGIRKAIRESAVTGRRDLADANCRGLRLRLTPAGSTTWVLACRDRFGRMRRFRLGSFPEVGISEARAAARTLHVRVKQDGADPVADRRRQRLRATPPIKLRPPLQDCWPATRKRLADNRSDGLRRGAGSRRSSRRT